MFDFCTPEFVVKPFPMLFVCQLRLASMELERIARVLEPELHSS